MAEENGDRSGHFRVVVVEDAYLLRAAFEGLLSRSEDIEVVRVCEDAESALSAVREEAPDAVLTDIRMPPTGTNEGIELAHTLRRTNPDLGVVVVSQYVEPRYVLDLLEQGAAGRAYLLKDHIVAPGQLVSAIRTVAAGGSVFDATVVDVLVKARARQDRFGLSELTPREREVLSLIAQGRSNAAIAQSLFLTKRAVEKYVNSIFMKLNLGDSEDVSRRVKAALIFLSED